MRSMGLGSHRLHLRASAAWPDDSRGIPKISYARLPKPPLSFAHPAHRGALSRGVLRMEQAGGGTGERVLTPAAGARQFRASDWGGARGRGSHPRTRAAAGLRPEVLWPPARSWLTAALKARC